MTPAARLQAAIELLDAIAMGDRPADAALAAFFRGRRFAGAKDKRAVTDRVWRILRHRLRYGWALGVEAVSPRILVIADLIVAEGLSPDAVAGQFSGARHGPEPMSANERRMAQKAAGRRDFGAAPRGVRLECPAWLLEKFDAAFGGRADAEIAALQGEAALDLRVNTLKSTRDVVMAGLEAAGLSPQATRLSPVGVRLQSRINLAANADFRAGLFEVQGEASQVCGLLVDARPGHAVLDLCAGAGGKSLAIAPAMNNKGRLVACDVLPRRLERAKLRLRRAGIHNATLRLLEGEHDKWLKRQAGAFDRVLVDAPCSGTGTWPRNPDARWWLTPGNLARLTATQDTLLDQAAPAVKPGGRLVYATCSLLPEENAGRIDAFLARHGAFRAVPVSGVWATAVGGPCPAEGPFLTLTPARHGTDGFFVAILERLS